MTSLVLTCTLKKRWLKVSKEVSLENIFGGSLVGAVADISNYGGAVEGLVFLVENYYLTGIAKDITIVKYFGLVVVDEENYVAPYNSPGETG